MESCYTYLDQNHWIYLAKDYWGKPHKETHRGIARDLLARVDSDQIRLPLSTTHFIEHLRAENSARRERLAEVFDRFSRGWHMASWTRVLPAEIHKAVADTFNEQSSMPQPELFGKGFMFGLGPEEKELLLEGRTEQQLNLLQSVAALPWAVLSLLTFTNEAGRGRQNMQVTESSRANTAAAEALRSVRKSHTTATRRRAQHAGYHLHHQDLMLSALAALGHTPEDFWDLGPEGISEFWSRVPSLDVDCELTLYRDRQWSKPVNINDVRDIGYLSLTLPYCDTVVTERFWARAIQETGLATKYRTVVCTDLFELLEHQMDG
jgi:hypothetical protein